MKTFLRLLFFVLGACSLQAQDTINVPLGTTWFIGSSHGGSDDGSEFWNAVYLRSPSGQLYYDGNFAGVNAPGGSTSIPIVLNEIGLWQEWENIGYVSNQGGENWNFLSRYLNVQGPTNRAPSIAWQNAPGAVETGQVYSVSAQGSDPDGNLAQVNVWKNGQPFAFAGGGDGSNGSSGNPTSDGSPQTVTFTAQAVDATGAVSEMIVITVTVTAPPPPVQYSLSTSASGGGSVSAGGIFSAGTPVTVTAAPDASHDFAGWAGDVSGATNPLGLTMDRDWNVQAVFILKSFNLATSASSGGSVSAGGYFPAGSPVTVSADPDAAHDFWGWVGDVSGASNPLELTMNRDWSVQAVFTLKSFNLATGASAGGSVTPGGTYTYGTTVTLNATPAPNYRFAGWAGDASGIADAIAITMDNPKSVYAQFASKAAQSISFTGLGSQAIGLVALNATATSGLPVSFALLSGPATLSGNQLKITGPGSITIEARQAGDDTYLSAPSVAQSFNVKVASATRYQSSARTILSSGATYGTAPLVLEKL